MAQTNLKSDAFCIYNASTSPFFYQMMPGQYANDYVFGEVGINAAGGTGGSYVRGDVIDISSFLSGRDDLLTKCNPPVPDLDELEQEPIKMQDSSNAVHLLPNYTREKKSAIDLSSVDYNRWNPLYTDPQNVRFVLEDMYPQRGGLDTQNYIKQAWNPIQESGKNAPNACKANLNPQMACGEFCDSVSGYPGTNPLTGQKKSAVSSMLGYKSKPPQDPGYPFPGPYSQQVAAVGAAADCGPNYYYGTNYDQGHCNTVNVDMLEGSAVSLNKFPLKI